MKKTEIAEVDFSRIRNNNEKRVLTAMERLLSMQTDFEPNFLDYQDVYALSMNSLPACYRQQGTVVLVKKISDHEIEQAVLQAIEQVWCQPNHSERRTVPCSPAESASKRL